MKNSKLAHTDIKPLNIVVKRNFGDAVGSTLYPNKPLPNDKVKSDKEISEYLDYNEHKGKVFLIDNDSIRKYG